MAAGPIIVIWMLAPELSTSSTEAMTAAAREALGREAEVRVEAAPDPDGMRLADVGAAAGAVRVSWDSAEHRRARLLAYLPRYQRWVDRELSFTAEDPESERGRTVGFLVASIFLDAGAVQRPSAARANEQPQPTKDAPSPPSAPQRATEHESASRPSGAHDGTPGPDAALSAAVIVAGPGTGSAFGGWLSGARRIGGAIWLGVAVQARLGDVDDAQASSRFLSAGLHSSWRFWSPAHNSWLGVRATAALAQVSLAHFSAEDAATVRRQRLLPAFELTMSSGYGLGATSALLFDVGAEMLGGKTEIYVHERRVATWLPLAVVARLGLETSF